MRKLRRQPAKINMLLEALARQPAGLPLVEAARLVYGSAGFEARQRLVRLLTTYRYKTHGRIDLRVSRGVIIPASRTPHSLTLSPAEGGGKPVAF